MLLVGAEFHTSGLINKFLRRKKLGREEDERLRLRMQILGRAFGLDESTNIWGVSSGMFVVSTNI